MKLTRTVLVFAAAALSAQAQITRVPNTTLSLPAQLPSASTFTTENALGTLTFSAPLDMASIPGVTNRLFVIERGGTIQLVNLDSMTKSTFMNLAGYLTSQTRPITTNSECGLLSMAVHPQFNQNGYFYLFYSLRISSQTFERVARFKATGTAGNFNAATAADPATESPLITQRDQQDNHNGGDMDFGPDGYLYISSGDEGAQYDGSDNARRIAKDFLGGIMRIDVDNRPESLAPNPHDESSTATVGDSAYTPGSYRIPPDNPFVALAQGTGNASYNGFTFAKTAIRTEWFAIGFRNPWRWSFDPLTGRLFEGDVGQDNFEEINIVTNGFNGGWSWREGLHAHTPNATMPNPPATGFNPTDPIFEYDHNGAGDSGNDAIISGSSGGGSVSGSVTGGVVYRGDRLPELFGKYLFCDYISGIVAALTEGPPGTWTGTRIATQISNISGWGYDPRNNDALLCNHVSGVIGRLVRSTTTGTAPPATLSAAGVFSDLSNLTPNAGIVAYEPNVPFWSDHALKSRWFSIRNTTDKIGYSADGNWTFPTGTVWVKHFDLELERGNPATKRKVETRILVKTASDVYGLSYQWNNIQSGSQTDATLVSEAGANAQINVTANGSPVTQTWSYPSRTDCRICHSAAGGYALSFNTRQLNKEHPYGAQTLNQIAALRDAKTAGGADAGYFTAATAPSTVSTLAAYAPASDASTSLEWRVRSFLAVNCSQCHQPGGTATGYWDARATTPTDLANLIDGNLVNDLADTSNKWCKSSGDLAHSMILKRLAGNGVQRMPPLGTNERNLEAEQLLSDWITTLPGRRTFAQWQVQYFGATPGPEAAPNADPDNDGQTNQQEYMTQTLPTDPVSLWSWNVSPAADGMLQFEFTQPANRSMQIEASTDFQNWSLWDAPGNTPSYPATPQNRTLLVPPSGPRLFFRPQFKQP
jgi:glucose/arabinose dehydrogenase